MISKKCPLESSTLFWSGLMLIQYGLVKIIKTQFPFPDLIRLTTPYGESSPMGLAWTFLGFSQGYNLFMGIAEMMGILFFFRRTVTIGAIISLMTTANVMAINYFYDVPVKLLSTALVVMSLFLVIPNFFRLYDFFMKGEAVQLRRLAIPDIQNKWLKHNRTTIKTLFIGISVVIMISGVLLHRPQYLQKLPLYGVYNVETFIWNKDSLAANPGQPTRWESLLIQRSDYSSVRFMHNHLDYCNLNVDTIKKQLNLTFKDDLNTTHQFTYNVPDPEHLELSGVYFGDSVSIRLQKQKFELTERPFSWVSEMPYNR